MHHKKLILLTLLYAVCLSISSASSQTMNISDKTLSEKSSDTSYVIYASYPQVDFGPDALMGIRGIAQDINNSIDNSISEIISKFKNDVAELTDKFVNGHNSTLEITSDAWISNGKILSVKVQTFENVSGMAHPMTTISTYNFTEDGNGPVNLSQLFLSNSGYVNFISNYCISQLKNTAQKENYENIDEMIEQGAFPDLKNFSEWTIRNDSLNIIFNPYQVAPYVMGIQNVSISLSELTSLLDPKGPLSFMFR